MIRRVECKALVAPAGTRIASQLSSPVFFLACYLGEGKGRNRDVMFRVVRETGLDASVIFTLSDVCGSDHPTSASPSFIYLWFHFKNAGLARFHRSLNRVLWRAIQGALVFTKLDQLSVLNEAFHGLARHKEVISVVCFIGSLKPWSVWKKNINIY